MTALNRASHPRNVAQRISITEADEANARSRTKCNRCKTPLRGGSAGDAKRDPNKSGYVCREDCRGN